MLEVDREKCNSCCGCIGVCPVDALTMDFGSLRIDHDKCIECGLCVKLCPVEALKLKGENGGSKDD